MGEYLDIARRTKPGAGGRSRGGAWKPVADRSVEEPPAKTPLEPYQRSSLEARWSTHRGWILVSDLATGERFELRVKDCADWMVREANGRGKRSGRVKEGGPSGVLRAVPIDSAGPGQHRVGTKDAHRPTAVREYETKTKISGSSGKPIGRLLNWPGSKTKLAAQIVDLLPEHRVYVEPFLGSAAVFLKKPPSPFEILNDKDGEVVNVFRVIRDRPEELARAIALTPYAEEELHAAHATSGEGLDPVERARRFLARCWMAHSARQTGRPSLGVARAGKNPVRVFNDLPGRILSAASRLKDAQIVCREAVDVIRANRHEDTLVYADPPYVVSTRSPNLYRYEMSDADHELLLETLLAHPGPVALSGFDSPLYCETLQGWKPVELKGYAQRGTRREMLWLNQAALRDARPSSDG